ncbi:MAG TPA: sensor histidine kinase N-terminal domain-containing protein [Burkholderiales bacterium]|nr:sensor histidine kinase N-terminal domain-containing protein [Burkholderiales bacterium]
MPEARVASSVAAESAAPPQPSSSAAAQAQRTWPSRQKTLRRQVLGWLFWPLVVLWSISSIFDYDIANRFVNLAYDRLLLESALDIGRQVKVLNNRIYVDLPEIAVQMLQSRESGRLYYLVTGPNREFITGEPDLPPPSDPLSERVNYYDDEYRGRPVRIVTLRLPLKISEAAESLVTVQVAENRAARNEFARQILVRMVLPQLLLILCAAVLLWYAVGRGLAPLQALRREIENRSHRDLSALPVEQTPQELQPLIGAMNELLERLSLALAAQQRFIADAAHQLRTPIAGIKTQTELALRQTPPGEARQTLEQLRTATERTTRLVNQLLSLARAEPPVGRVVSVERIDLEALARSVTTEWVPLALERDVDLGFDADSQQAHIEGDAFLLREMLGNLLDNAIRYTQRGGQVTVRVQRDARHALLSVEDNGRGIADTERARVFEPFYRVLGTGAEGCGLGLSIVREIAQSHGGYVELLPASTGAGTLARVSIPLTRS